MNFGLDAHFLNKRIILTGDYYIRDSESMIFNYALPVTTGYTEAKNNLVSVRNSGVELQLSLDLLPHNWDWSWTIDANIAMNKKPDQKIAERQPEYCHRSSLDGVDSDGGTALV